MLAKELLSKPDGFITVSDGEREYTIESFRRVATHANYDDSVMHWTLNIKENNQGNIKRWV